jgi:hypothetical protein
MQRYPTSDAQILHCLKICWGAWYLDELSAQPGDHLLCGALALP